LGTVWFGFVRLLRVGFRIDVPLKVNFKIQTFLGVLGFKELIVPVIFGFTASSGTVCLVGFDISD